MAIPLGLVGCKDKDDNVVRVCEVTHSVFYAPLYIAINNGYFEEYDIFASGSVLDRAQYTFLA